MSQSDISTVPLAYGLAADFGETSDAVSEVVGG